MAAISLAGVSCTTWPYTATVGATWQEFTLPAGRFKLTIQNTHATQSLYYAPQSAGLPASAETPADGGVVGTHRFTVRAGTDVELYTDHPGQLGRVTKFFLAGSGAGTNYTLLIEGA